MNITTGNKVALSLYQSSISKGGEGEVFQVMGTPKECVKIYLPGKKLDDREKKLSYMVTKAPNTSNFPNIKLCWPNDLVYKNNKFTGFKMPMAFDDSIELQEFTLPRFGKKFPHAWEKKFDRNNGDGVAIRLKLCANLAIAIHLIHSLDDYVIVDLKPANILVSHDGKISVIDLDSIQISRNNRVEFSAPVSTPEYSPPEASRKRSRKIVEKSWDTFALAVVLYQVIFGLHPYAATSKGKFESATTTQDKISSNLFVHGSNNKYIDRPSLHENFYKLPQSIQNLFIRAFDKTEHDRPSAEEWGKTLYHEIQIYEKRKQSLKFSHLPKAKKPPKKGVNTTSKRVKNTVSTTAQSGTRRRWFVHLLAILGFIATLILSVAGMIELDYEEEVAFMMFFIAFILFLISRAFWKRRFKP